MSLEPSDIEAIAQRVAQLVQPPIPLVTVDQLATILQVDRGWVYDRWQRLGGVKIGAGRNAPIRFDLTKVHRLATEGALAREEPVAQPANRRRRTATSKNLPDGVEMIQPRGAGRRLAA
jgi:hypothetical protein